MRQPSSMHPAASCQPSSPMPCWSSAYTARGSFTRPAVSSGASAPRAAAPCCRPAPISAAAAEPGRVAWGRSPGPPLAAPGLDAAGTGSALGCSCGPTSGAAEAGPCSSRSRTNAACNAARLFSSATSCRRGEGRRSCTGCLQCAAPVRVDGRPSPEPVSLLLIGANARRGAERGRSHAAGRSPFALLSSPRPATPAALVPLVAPELQQPPRCPGPPRSPG